MAKNPGKVVNPFVFSQLLHEAWTDAMTSLNIKAGFRTMGIYPLDQNAVTVKIRKPIMDTDASKINYISFLYVAHYLEHGA